MLLEAMASGVQIVASDLPSFVDLLGAPQDEQRLGEVFTVGDHRALARAVLQVLDHPNPLRAARAQQAASSYDWSRVGTTRSCRLSSGAFRSACWTDAGAVSDEHAGDAGPDDHRCGALGLADQLARQPSPSGNTRAERTWSALDAALVGRAQRAAELVRMPGIDPATALLVLDAAAAALEPDLLMASASAPRVT